MEDARFVDIPHVFKEKAVDVIFCPCCQRKDEELKVSPMRGYFLTTELKGL